MILRLSDEQTLIDVFGKVLKGSIVETRFATPSHPGSQGPLKRTSLKSFELNKVSYMADCVSLGSLVLRE